MPGLPRLPDLPHPQDPQHPQDLQGLPPIPQIGPVTRRPPPGGARREWQFATVREVRVETARMKSYRLACSLPVLHVPGQHVVVRLTAPNGYTASRSYSIASAPGDGSEIEIMVERLDDGEVSMYLHDELGVGDELEIRGPFGGWFVWNGRGPALLIGGGSGVVPLMAMLRHARRIAEERGRAHLPMVRLVESVRSPDELPFATEYGDETTIVYTRAAPPDWEGPVGRINAAILEPLLIDGATAYVCGSAGFAERASQLLVEIGQPVSSIRVERYGPTG
jgi:ferredoxin-NADP reductase